ncbi:MAG: serine/threonine-protein kinase [Planctomycetota bacterium]
MRAAREDLLAGALGLAYKYCTLADLRRAFAAVQDGGEQDLPAALEQAKAIQAPWAQKLRRGALMAARLREEAVYGMIAIRNQLVGGQMLNACMEEVRKRGYAQSLPDVLLERGLLTDALHAAVQERTDSAQEELFAKEVDLAALIDLERDPEDMLDLKLGALLGEVAASVSFLTKPDLDAALKAQERVEQGLPAEEEAPARAGPGRGSGVVSIKAPEPPTPQPTADGDDPIKGYELLEKLGAGAMGAVLRARKRDTGEIVALKILKPELANDREYVERFLREAKAVARLGHKNIVRAVQVGRSGDYYFFAMEFLQGQTVSDMIKAQGRLQERFSIMVIRCIASALAHAWQHQIVHRDIKPDNIMVTQDGQVKLTDLGLARTAKRDSTLTITGVVMGSPAYISPEQATGEKDLDARSDIYALGATLYHMLSGNVPYDGESPLHVMLKHMNDPLPDVQKVVPGVSDATKLMIQRMMAKRPEGRFQSALQVEALAKQIEEALAQNRVPVVPPGLAPMQPGAPRPAAPAGAPAAKPQQTQARPAAPRAADPATSVEDLGASQSGEDDGSGKKKRKKKKKKTASPEQEKRKEMGERLRRMKEKKRRF